MLQLVGRVEQPRQYRRRLPSAQFGPELRNRFILRDAAQQVVSGECAVAEQREDLERLRAHLVVERVDHQLARPRDLPGEAVQAREADDAHARAPPHVREGRRRRVVVDGRRPVAPRRGVPDAALRRLEADRLGPTCVQIKISHGVFVLNRRVIHAIDAPPARWRGDAGFSPLDGASAAASSLNAPDILVDFRTATGPGGGACAEWRSLRLC